MASKLSAPAWAIFLALARFTGVDAVRRAVAGASSRFLACSFQANVGINPEGKPLLLAPNRYFQRQYLPPAGADFEIESATIEELVSFVRGFAERILMSVRGIFGGNSLSRSASCPQRCPQNGGSCSGTALDHAGHYTTSKLSELQAFYGCYWNRLEVKLVEAGGIEPPSEGLPSDMPTCLAAVLISLFEPPTAGSRRAIRFGSQPHPLRQENRPIPLNDVLSNPVGESR